MIVAIVNNHLGEGHAAQQVMVLLIGVLWGFLRVFVLEVRVCLLSPGLALLPSACMKLLSP